MLGDPKGEDLERLSQCLAGWIRRTFRRDPVFGFYAGQEALRFHAEGGEFRQD